MKVSKIFVKLHHLRFVEYFQIFRIMITKTSLILLISFSAAFAQLDTQWVKLYVGENDDEIYDHIETADGGFAFTGYHKPDNRLGNRGGVWLGKTDQNGELQWSYRHRYGENYCFGYSLFEQEEGGFVIFGYTRIEDEDHNRWDKILALQTNADGDSVLWYKTYGGEGWEQAYKAIQTNDGGYALTGKTTSFEGGREDFFLLKLDENCDSLWMRAYGGNSVDIAYDLIQTSDSGYALVGSTTMVRNSPTDYWALFVDENGDSLRSYVGSYRGRATSTARTIQEMNDGTFIVSGYMQDPILFSNYAKIWTLALDADAQILWDRVDGDDINLRRIGGYASCLLTDTSIAITGSHQYYEDNDSPFGKLWILVVTTSGEGEFILDEDWDLPTYGNSIILTSSNELSVAGYAGQNRRDTWYDGLIFKTSELPNSVESGFSGAIPHRLLISAYPNPFNGMATFNFSVIQPGVVNIEVFNSLGRRQTGILSRFFAAGEYTTNWNGRELPSGDYLIRMTTGEQVSTRKVTMIK